jgi:hypothetical protein
MTFGLLNTGGTDAYPSREEDRNMDPTHRNRKKIMPWAIATNKGRFKEMRKNTPGVVTKAINKIYRNTSKVINAYYNIYREIFGLVYRYKIEVLLKVVRFRKTY